MKFGDENAERVSYNVLPKLIGVVVPPTLVATAADALTPTSFPSTIEFAPLPTLNPSFSRYENNSRRLRAWRLPRLLTCGRSRTRSTGAS
jgi:hypothetical protein